MKLFRTLFLSTAALLIGGLTGAVRAETLDCTPITSLPYVITTQGIYCLTGNLSTSMTSGRAIDIQTNNVTIDLNGYKLGGLGAGDGTTAFGIYAYQRKNITIKNGIVRGFDRGIWLNDASPYTASAGNTVKNILADQNTYTGIDVRGLGNTVENSKVVDTGGSTAHTLRAYGIMVGGSGAKIVNNDVSTTTIASNYNVDGIFLFSADYSLVQNNTVTNTVTLGTGNTFSILRQDSEGVFVRDNNLGYSYYGLYFSNSTGKYLNNLTFHVGITFTGGTAVGSNNY